MDFESGLPTRVNLAQAIDSARVYTDLQGRLALLQQDDKLLTVQNQLEALGILRGVVLAKTSIHDIPPISNESENISVLAATECTFDNIHALLPRKGVLSLRHESARPFSVECNAALKSGLENYRSLVHRGETANVSLAYTPIRTFAELRLSAEEVLAQIMTCGIIDKQDVPIQQELRDRCEEIINFGNNIFNHAKPEYILLFPTPSMQSTQAGWLPCGLHQGHPGRIVFSPFGTPTVALSGTGNPGDWGAILAASPTESTLASQEHALFQMLRLDAKREFIEGFGKFERDVVTHLNYIGYGQPGVVSLPQNTLTLFSNHKERGYHREGLSLEGRLIMVFQWPEPN